MEKRHYWRIFLVSTFILLFALILDNLLWINASPEYLNPHTVINWFGSWTGAVVDFTFGQLMSYIFGYRVLTVLSNWRDLTSGLFFGGVITLIVFIHDHVKRKIKKWRRK